MVKYSGKNGTARKIAAGLCLLLYWLQTCPPSQFHWTPSPDSPEGGEREITLFAVQILHYIDLPSFVITFLRYLKQCNLNIILYYSTLSLSETYSRVRVGRFLSDAFPIHYGLKKGDALSPLLFNFAVEQWWPTRGTRATSGTRMLPKWHTQSHYTGCSKIPLTNF